MFQFLIHNDIQTNYLPAIYPGPHWDTISLPFTGSYSDHRHKRQTRWFPPSVWNYNEVLHLIPSATFVTLLRDPVDCWESNYVYMGLQNAFKMDINEFAASEKVSQSYFKRVRQTEDLVLIVCVFFRHGQKR